MTTDPMPPMRPVDAPGGSRGKRRWRVVALVAVAVVVVGVVITVAVARFWGPSWGTPADRVVSPTGEYEVVTYEWTALIDPGWNLFIQRVGGEEREWFWRSAESPALKSVRFTGPTSIEVTDRMDQVYLVDFDPASLEPSDRFCLNGGYCSDAPWNGYTRSGP
jgi:hypothetical protein